MPLFGPPNIVKLKARRDVKGLIKALGYPKNVPIRQRAAQALGRLADASAVDALILALHDTDKDVRVNAAQALGIIGSVRAVEPLITALRDANSEVRWSTAEALGKLGWLPGQDRTGACYWAAKLEWEKCVMIGAPAIEALISSLAGLWTEDVVKALAKIGSTAVEPLLAALKDLNPRVRCYAAQTLGVIGDAHAVETLIEALKDNDTLVRQQAALALGEVGDARAVEPLIRVLCDKEFGPRDGAVIALGKIGDHRAVEALISSALKDDLMRVPAVRALGKIGDPRAIEPLIAALNDEKWNVRRAAGAVLVALFQSNQLDPPTRQQILNLHDRIVISHTDEYGCSSHADRGIGIDFPL
jgi:HEAT repeat protein